MSSFRYPVNIERLGPGTYDGPNWVPGAPVADTIMATVQPATVGDYDQMAALLEGRRVEGLIRIYTDAQLQVAGETDEASGDRVIWPEGLRDRKYEVLARSPWQSRIIPHYRYLAALLTEPR